MITFPWEKFVDILLENPEEFSQKILSKFPEENRDIVREIFALEINRRLGQWIPIAERTRLEKLRAVVYNKSHGD